MSNLIRDAGPQRLAPSHSADRLSRRRSAFLRPVWEGLEARCLLSAIPLPSIPNSHYDVVGGYGAVGDGTTDNTTAIQTAINAAANAGGGTVEIPNSGIGVFMTGELVLQSNINLQIDAGVTLQNTSPSNTLITTSGSTTRNIEISGGGTLDGHATATSGNNMLVLEHITNLEVTNVTIENASHEHFVPEYDTNVTINNVTIQDPLAVANGGYLANTDGIDYSGSNFLIENCNINDGDDDIVAKPQHTYCSNITIENCTIGAGHGISVGGQTNDGLTGMLVYNVTFNGTSVGVRLKAGRGNGGIVSNVIYSHIKMTNVADPIIIDSYYNGSNNYPSDSTTDPGQPVNSLTPFWNNITYSNIIATGASTGVIIYGLPEAPVRNLTFINVHITATSSSKINHVRNLVMLGTTAFKITSTANQKYDNTIWQVTSSGTTLIDTRPPKTIASVILGIT